MKVKKEIRGPLIVAGAILVAFAVVSALVPAFGVSATGRVRPNTHWLIGIACVLGGSAGGLLAVRFWATVLAAAAAAGVSVAVLLAMASLVAKPLDFAVFAIGVPSFAFLAALAAGLGHTVGSGARKLVGNGLRHRESAD